MATDNLLEMSDSAFIAYVRDKLMSGKINCKDRSPEDDDTMLTGTGVKKDGGGGDNEYYRQHITHPKRTEPYFAECEDIIAALKMTHAEGEVFKATWRKASLRLTGGKPGDTELRNAEKMVHYSTQILRLEKLKGN